MICGACGGSGWQLRVPLGGRLRDWFQPCTGFCRGTGVTSTAVLNANPRPNQIDWWGAFFARASTYFTAELPAYAGDWFRPLATCCVWDSRDWYEPGGARP